MVQVAGWTAPSWTAARWPPGSSTRLGQPEPPLDVVPSSSAVVRRPW